MSSIFSPLSTKGAGERPLAVVVGAGRSGLAACWLLAREKARVRLLEENPAKVDAALGAELSELGVELCLGAHSRGQFAGASLVVPSPGMPLLKLLEIMGEAGEGEGAPRILAETELAYRFLDGEKIVAVTGTSGKTTTVSLARAMLEKAGVRTFLGGNIGTPLSEYVLSGQKAEVLVLEVSSFQLQVCSTFRPDVAALINLSPNHLDYHRDMQEYADAKFKIFACQDEGDLALVPQELAEEAKERGVRSKIAVIEPSDRFSDMKLFGAHNALNAETAWQLVRGFGVSLETAQAAAREFNPLPHRLERVCESKNGVLFVNDSKSTTIASMEIALKAMDRPVLLLCGGRFKGGDLEGVKPLLKEKVRLVAGFGESEEHFAPAWKDAVPVSWFPTLRPAMEHLFANARGGEVILLSPGTSSFDLYKGMAYRGKDFKEVAGELSS